MIRNSIVLLIAANLLNADFISKYEYGEMLYKNPRGISCAGCHGERGEGKPLATIRDDKKPTSITAPGIKNKPRAVIAGALRNKRSIMPVYQLTPDEIEALYIYLNTQKESPIPKENP